MQSALSQIVPLSASFVSVICHCCDLFCFDVSFIVTGDVLGHVKFFDQELKLIHWYFVLY